MFSDITPTQYETALTWLDEAQLLTDLHSSLTPAHRVFAGSLVYDDPPWLRNADDLVRYPDELPDDAVRIASALGLDTAVAFALTIAASSKVDTQERNRVGVAGEAALVGLLGECTSAEVDHVAVQSDGYGYDIAVRLDNFALHLEVKSTVRRHRTMIYISRNEYDVMLRDPAWRLVVVYLNPGDEIVAVATVNSGWIEVMAPADQGTRGRWESCRLDVPDHVMVNGIPALGSVLLESAPPSKIGILK